MADRCIITLRSNVSYGDFWVVQPALRTEMGFDLDMADIASTNSTYGTVSFQTFPKVATSPDGETWTNQADFSNKWTNAYVRQIKGFGDLFVVVGDQARVAFSLNEGVTWTLNTNFGAVHAGAIIMCIGYDGAKFIALTSTGKCASSIDLISWTDVPGFAASGWGTGVPREIAYADGLWVACGPNGGVNTSTDGINWTYRSITGIPGTKTLSFRDMTYGKGRWVLVGEQGLCAYSTNGINWFFNGNLDAAGWGATTVYGICFDGDRFYAVGHQAQFAKSSDAINWTLDTEFIDDPLWAIGADAFSIIDKPNGQMCVTGKKSLAANSASTTPEPVVKQFYHLPRLGSTLTRQAILEDGNLGPINASIVITGISAGGTDTRTLMTNGTELFVFCNTQILNKMELYRIDRDLTVILDSNLTVNDSYAVGVCPSGFLNTSNGSPIRVYGLGIGMQLIGSEFVDRLGSSEGATPGQITTLQSEMDADPWVAVYVDNDTLPYLPIDLGNITAQGFVADTSNEFNWDLDYSINNAVVMPDNATMVMRNGKVYDRPSGNLINQFTPITFSAGRWQEHNGDELWMLTVINELHRLPDYRNSPGGDVNFIEVTGHFIGSSADAILIA